MKCHLRRCVLLCGITLAVLVPRQLNALSVDLNNMVFSPANDPINFFTINVTTDTIGDDSDTSTVTGAISAKLDFDLVGTTVQPTGIELTGGLAMFSDTEFSFLFGIVSASGTGLAGVPDTPSPPSIVTAGTFQAGDHAFLLNQGTIEAAGQTIDLATTPFLASGTGIGQVVVSSTGPPNGNEYSYNATVTIPTTFDEPFTVTEVPVVGTVNGNFAGGGTIQVSQDFTLSILPGDYDLSGSLDCTDLGLLEQAVAMGSTDPVFDANGDGVIGPDDPPHWISNLRQAIAGDGNLDDVVNGLDFDIWNANKFQTNTGWCSGDWNHDGQTNGRDFLTWNANKSLALNPTAVPEPGCACYVVVVLLANVVRGRGSATD